MDTKQLTQLQQLEFFLLYDLAVKELKLLKNTKRIAPISCDHERDPVRAGMAVVNRLFRSALVKVFPSPFKISKRPYSLEFTIGMPMETQNKLLLNKNSPPYQDLITPADGETGFLRFNFPRYLNVYLGRGTRYRRSRWHRNDYGITDIGAGQYCNGLKTIIAWKKRLEAVLDYKETIEIKPPEHNLAQEALEAVLRDAAAAGKL